MDASGASAVDWVRELRRHKEGVVLADGRARQARVVIEGKSGHLVMPVEAIELESEEIVVFLPRESNDALQVLCRPEEIDLLREEACDRWLAYHGRTDLRRWARLVIEGARRDDSVIDAETITAPNPLTAVEGRLCRMLNADRLALVAACERGARVKVAEPGAVGVDPHGVDVRARFGIVRLEFAAPAEGEQAAGEAIRGLLAARGDAGVKS